MDLSIERIEIAGPDGRARRLVFSDDSDSRVTSKAVVKDLSLEAGAVVGRAALEHSLGEVETRLAKERALRLLGSRERSTSEIARRLSDDGYPPAVRAETVHRMIELGLIDDARFALLWARQRLGAGYGRRRITQELKERGIDSDSAVAAIMEAADGAGEIDQATAAMRGAVPASRKDRERLIRRLVARGFDLSVAISAVDGTRDDGTA